MNKAICSASIIAVGAFIFSSCSQPSSQAEKSYPLRGKVVSVNAADKTLTLDHEDIPGLMKAMQMKFHVDDAAILNGIKPDCQVEGHIKNESGKFVITSLKECKTVDDGQGKKIEQALAKLAPEDRAIAQAQKVCPVSDEPLGSMNTPVKVMIKGKPVFVCCKGCQEDAEKDADATLAKVEKLKSTPAPTK